MFGRLKKLLGQAEEAPPTPEEIAPEPGVEAAPEPEPEPVLEFLSYDEILRFRTTRQLPLLEDFETTLAISEGVTEPLVLRPRTREATGRIEWEYTADVSGSEHALAVLRERYGPEIQARGGQAERRSQPRHRNRIRVRSRQLPLFQGLTHDLTTEGVRLIVEGEVAPGTALELDMQLDHDRLPNVTARGVVAWSAPSEGRNHWAGVRLTEVSDQATLDEYVAGIGGATEDGLTRKNFL